MKKWMALLLCGLLCLYAAGAMAEEPVTLSLNEGNQIDIYPDGYQEKNKTFVSYKGPYVITGESTGVDTCLDFYSIPHNASQDTEPVTYTVTFKNVSITAGQWCTAIRFGDGEGEGEGEGTVAKDITLNLINIGKSNVKPYNNHAVFSNQFWGEKKNVTVNIHNTLSSSLKLAGQTVMNQEQEEWGVAGTNVTVNIGTQTINNDNNSNIESLQISDSQCRIGDAHPAKLATCNDEGNVEYWQCATCQTYAISVNGNTKSVLPEEVFISKLPHLLTHVPAKPATCTEEGNIEHWKCTGTCGKLFADANGTKELTADDIRLPAQHITQKVEAKTPTTEADGHIEHYLCTRCKALFADEKATTELTADEVILPKLVRTDSLPQTGDSSHLLRWMAVLLGACFGIVAVRSRRRG